MEKISPRVLILELEGNPKSTIIPCYSPTNSSDGHDVDDFYSILRSVLDEVPSHNFLIIPGDFNAKIGPGNASFPYNNTTNINGENLIDFMEEYRLLPTNIKFMKCKRSTLDIRIPK